MYPGAALAGAPWERQTLVWHVLFLPFWERRTLVRHVFSFSRRALSLASLSSVFSVRNLFFDLWNERKPGYRAVAKRRNAYAAMPSPEAYRAVAKRKGAYAAMPVWGYRGVSGFYDPAIRPLPFNRDGRRKNRIAPSRKEGALTPRCSCVLSRGKWFLRPRDPPFILLTPRCSYGSSQGNQRADFGSPRSLAILMKSSTPLE